MWPIKWLYFLHLSNQGIGERAITLASNWFPFQCSKINKYEDHFFQCSLCHIINLLLTKVVRSRWLGIGLILFLFIILNTESELINDFIFNLQSTWRLLSKVVFPLFPYLFRPDVKDVNLLCDHWVTQWETSSKICKQKTEALKEPLFTMRMVLESQEAQGWMFYCNPTLSWS
mgnify:CR=1 FL=1